jgi:uncharacterized protein
MSLAEALQTLHGSNELTMAAVVSADGLIVDVSASPEVDAESICSVASNGLLMMDALAQEIDEGATELVTLEYAHHLLMLAPLDNENLLVLLSGPGMNLGRMRVILRRWVPRLTEALGSV